jgi:hypothetical protein
LHLGSLPISDRRAHRHAAGSGNQAGPESSLESAPESAPTYRRAAKTAAIKSGVVRTASTKAATPVVENTAAESAVHAAEAASAVHAATTATARRHNVGGKHCKCCSRQQRDRDFTEHD